MLIAHALLAQSRGLRVLTAPEIHSLRAFLVFATVGSFFLNDEITETYGVQFCHANRSCLQSDFSPGQTRRVSYPYIFISEQPVFFPAVDFGSEKERERTLLYNGLPGDVSDGEHGVEYVAGKENKAESGSRGGARHGAQLSEPHTGPHGPVFTGKWKRM